MSKEYRLRAMPDEFTQALNAKRAELLLQGKDYTRECVLLEIVREWRELKAIQTGPQFVITGSVKASS